MPISLRILFQLIKPKKDGRFITDGIEEHVPAVGCQVQFPGSFECLGIARCPAVDEKKVIVFDDPQGLIYLSLALGES